MASFEEIREYKEKAFAAIQELQNTNNSNPSIIFSRIIMIINILSEDPGLPRDWKDKMTNSVYQIRDAYNFLLE